MSIEWNSLRLGGRAHRIVAKTGHKTLPGGEGGGVLEGSRGGGSPRGGTVQGWCGWGPGGVGSRECGV